MRLIMCNQNYAQFICYQFFENSSFSLDMHKNFIIFKILMLGICLASETFQRLLFKTEMSVSSTKSTMSTVLVTQNPQPLKKNLIVIISNGIQQRSNMPKRKKYVFTDDEIDEQISQAKSQTHQKKHIIKKEKKEDPDYAVKRQKGDRNVVSNIIHHLMKHVMSSTEHQQLEKVFRLKNIELSIHNFLKTLEQKNKMCKTYITGKHLKCLWNDPEKPEYSKAMRILSRIFLQNYSFLTIFNGNKLNNESKEIHYKGRRQLLQILSKLK